MNAKDVLKEILEAEIGAGKPLEGIEAVKLSNENLTDKAKFILLWNQTEENMPNIGNRFSLCKRTVEMHMIFRDAEQSSDTIRAAVIAKLEAARSVIKANPTLQCTSVPAGFAVRTEIGEMQDATPDLGEGGINSHAAIASIGIWYFVQEWS
jgi:hypothetical protein